MEPWLGGNSLNQLQVSMPKRMSMFVEGGPSNAVTDRDTHWGSQAGDQKQFPNVLSLNVYVPGLVCSSLVAIGLGPG